jgi:hypothetical protein
VFGHGKSYAATAVNGGALGLLALTRFTVHEDPGVNATVDVINDFVNYTASNLPGGLFAFSPWLSTPPPGTCTVYQRTGDFLSTGQLPSGGQPTLDGGTGVTVVGPGGQQNATLGAGASAALGSYLPLYSFPNQLSLTPGFIHGDYQRRGRGGTNHRNHRSAPASDLDQSRPDSLGGPHATFGPELDRNDGQPDHCDYGH